MKYTLKYVLIIETLHNIYHIEIKENKYLRCKVF